MEPIQLTIIIISVVLTTLFVFLGIQVWHILKEMKHSLEKINKMLDDAGKVTGTVSTGVSGMAGLVEGLKTGLSVFSAFRKKHEDYE